MTFTGAGPEFVLGVVPGFPIALENDPMLSHVSPEKLTRLQQTVGLQTRYRAAEGQRLSDIIHAAFPEFLAQTGLTSHQIQGLIIVSQTPDQLQPATSHIVQAKLGLNASTICIDIAQGCTGYVTGLMTAMSWIHHGLDHVLLVCGDMLSPYIDASDSALAPLFGDGITLSHVTRQPGVKATFQSVVHGEGRHVLEIPHPPVPNTVFDAQGNPLSRYLHMDGMGVMDFALREVPAIMNPLLAHADHAKVYFHQANLFLTTQLAKLCNINTPQLGFTIIPKYGNIGSASIPMAMAHDAPYAGDAILCGFGVGMAVATCSITQARWEGSNMQV